MAEILINYCHVCGSPTEQAVPKGDQKTRDICTECGNIHYKNPKIITGCLIEHDNRVLLCQRGIEPQYGKWTLPAGFMENNETCEQGASRESYEEAGVEVRNLQLYAVYDIPYISQVYMIYRAVLGKPGYAPGEESLDVQLFDRHDLPWELLSFSVIREILVNYFHDREHGAFSLHTGIITPDMKKLTTVRPDGF